jgi:hypothetical protein
MEEAVGGSEKGKLGRWLKRRLAVVSGKLSAELRISILVSGKHPATSGEESQVDQESHIPQGSEVPDTTQHALQYSTLNLQGHEIRLVQLYPRRTSADTIQCNLVTANLDENPRYEALSYEWGLISPKLQITVNGSSALVRENLWWALNHLQLEDEMRILWIDALCINQGNTIERNHQVAQMGKIYSSAMRCAAWIGREQIVRSLDPLIVDDSFELAMEFVKKVEKGENAANYSNGLSPHGKKEHDSLESLCHRKYWGRLWIIQEILLSTDVVVQCGPYEVSWQALSHIFNDLRSSVHASSQFSISSSAPFRLNQQSNARREGIAANKERSAPLLAELVLQFKDSRCEDPRDTVFGLLSLAQDCCRETVRADYSALPEEICTALLMHRLLSHLDLRDRFPDISIDIQELCETIIFNSKRSHMPRRADASVASASMKAVHNIHDIFAHRGPRPIGRVIWLLSLIRFKEAVRHIRPEWSTELRVKNGIGDRFDIFMHRVGLKFGKPSEDLDILSNWKEWVDGVQARSTTVGGGKHRIRHRIYSLLIWVIPEWRHVV